MQLPFLKPKEKQQNFFLSLLIKPDRVGAILFEEINSKLFILSTNEIDTGEDTAKLSEEELLAAADKAISFVEGKLIALSAAANNSSSESLAVSSPVSISLVDKMKSLELISSKRIAPTLSGLIRSERKKFCCFSLGFKNGNCINIPLFYHGIYSSIIFTETFLLYYFKTFDL